MAKKTNDYDYDMNGLKAVQAEAKQVKENGAKRQENWPAFKRMVFQEWDEKPSDPSVKVTIHPGPRNKILGLRNLLASTAPQFNVPRDKNNPDAERISSALEHAANTMWNTSNRVQSKRTEADMAVSAGIYDEIHIDIISTNDILKSLQEAWEEAKKEQDYDARFDAPRWEAKIERAKQTAERTPYLFRLANPEVIYPAWSGLGGMLARYSEVEMYVADVRHTYGSRAIPALAACAKADYKTVTVCAWLDPAYKFVWLDEAKDTPIYAETHGLNFMPCVGYRVTGTDLFVDAKHTNEGFLYGVLKSGIWQAQNTMLTAARTALFGVGLNAPLFYQKADDQDELKPINRSVIGGVIQGRGSLRPLMNDIITKDFQALWSVFEGMFEESTIYGSALGEKLSATTTFSETALLAQQGRLPIVPIQKAMQESAAQAMNVAFMWMRSDKKGYGMIGNLQLTEIPSVIEFDVTVEPDLPQDKVQAGQVAASLAGGENPLMSQAWGRELLGEGQSDEMQHAIWTERMSGMAFEAGAAETLQMAVQAASAITGMVTGKTPPAPPPPTGPAQGAMAQPEVMPPGQVPPEEMPNMAPEVMP